MRYREPFTVFKRTMKSGKIIWYYQTYDEENRRTTARSTGQTSKSAARSICYQLMKEDKLIPKSKGNMTFAEYAENWWIWDKCEYVAYRRSRRNMSQSYVSMSRGNTNKHILPVFGKKRMRDIKSYDIENWLQTFAEKGLANKTANNSLVTLRTMLNDAVRRGILDVSPMKNITKLKDDGRVKGIFSTETVEKLFDSSRQWEIWTKESYYIANLTAAFTGMRIAEILGLQSKNIHDSQIDVENQYVQTQGLTDTKNHKERTIPIPDFLEKELNKLKTDNPESFLFSNSDVKTTPYTSQSLRLSLYHALERVGISREEQKKQNITFHSWRHYFNTLLLRNNVSEQKIRMMTGHSSAAMTEHYTHLDMTDLNEVKDIQNSILNFPQKVG